MDKNSMTMNMQTIDNKDEFQQVMKSFSMILYPNHDLPNLQCNEIINKNFDKGFVLYHENNIVALACVIINPFLLFEGKQTICISHYECIENTNASKKLLQSIIDYCQKLNYKYVIGPMNGSTWDSYRFAVDPINDSYVSETYHKNYYAKQFEDFGFQTATEYITQIDKSLQLPSLVNNLDENISFRTLNENNYHEEMKNIFIFCKDIFQNNFLYTNINGEDFISKYTNLKNSIDPKLVIIAEDKGEIVGLLLALDDFYSKNEKRLIVKTLGRKNDPKYFGLGYILSFKIMEIVKQNKYESVLHVFMEQKNASKNVSNKFSGKTFRTYKLYYKKL